MAKSSAFRCRSTNVASEGGEVLLAEADQALLAAKDLLYGRSVSG
jgi:hypothetical protein